MLDILSYRGWRQLRVHGRSYARTAGHVRVYEPAKATFVQRSHERYQPVRARIQMWTRKLHCAHYKEHQKKMRYVTLGSAPWVVGSGWLMPVIHLCVREYLHIHWPTGCTASRMSLMVYPVYRPSNHGTQQVRGVFTIRRYMIYNRHEHERISSWPWLNCVKVSPTQPVTVKT